MSDDSGEQQINGAYTIGAILRGAREASGESTEDVSRILRINWRYLQALEEGQFENLPGSAYAIGFIKTYATHLGIDSTDLIDQYKALGETAHSKTALEFPEPIPETGLPGGAILFAGIIVAVLAYGGWYLATEEDSFLAEMVSPVPEHLAEATGENTEEQPSAEEAAVPQPTVIEETAPEAEQAVGQVSEQVAETADAVEEAAEAVVEASDDAVEEVVAVADEVAETTEEAVEEVTDAVSGSDAPAEEIEADSASAVVAESADAVSESAEATVEETAQEVAEEAQEVTEAVEEATEQVTEQVVEETAEEPAEAPVSDEPQEEAEADVVAEAEPEVVMEQPAEPETTEIDSAESEEQVAATSSDAPEADTSAGRVFGDEGSARIVVRAKTNGWIQVRDDSTGQLLLTRMLRTGDEYHVPDRSGLSLLTGNAGALEIMVDGEPVPAIGGTGDVRRDVALDAERLLAGDAATE